MEDIVQGSDGYFTVCVKNYISKPKYEIEEYFSQFGTVVSVRTIEKDPRLAFVRYMLKEEVIRCLEITKNDRIYQVSMANTRPRGGNTPGCDQPHVKPCGFNQPVLQYLQLQGKQKKSAPSGDTERDKQQKSAPSGDTGRDERRKPRPSRGPVREQNWDTENSGNEENEENWDADTEECEERSVLGASGSTNNDKYSLLGASGNTNGDKYSLLGASGNTNGENFNAMEASGRTSGDKYSLLGASGSTNGGPSQDTKSNESSRLGGDKGVSAFHKHHPGIDIVILANLPDDIRPRNIYILCYDADPLFISPFKRVESENNTLYCVVYLDKETADKLVNKLNGKTFKGKKLIALRLEK